MRPRGLLALPRETPFPLEPPGPSIVGASVAAFLRVQRTANPNKTFAGHRNRATGDPAKANGLCGERRSQGTGGIFRLREMEHCDLCFDEIGGMGQKRDDKRGKV